MKARETAGLILVYGAWVPVIVWQTLPAWGPPVLGELRYQAIMAAPGVDVVGWIWFVGMFAAGFYLLFDVTILERLWRWLRGRFARPPPAG
jgi:hypothetical protein